ncbi:MAG: PhzF family phenazine biosynthesis protein [Bacteroidota bacterium]
MKYYHVDTFTNKIFAGNPAGVCILTAPKDEQWMQNIATEMNLPITAFLMKQENSFGLRWFTPTIEISLCGHGTLASAHILREKGILRVDEKAKFLTKSGPLIASKVGNLIELDFPLEEIRDAAAPPDLLEELKVQPTYIGKSRTDYLIEVESEEILRNIAPDFASLKKVKMRGVMITSRSSNTAFDFVSRFFAPAVGVNEDHVTGSSHCCLGPYWQKKLNKTNLLAYQASARGGVISVRIGSERVFLGGEAVTVFTADLKDE